MSDANRYSALMDSCGFSRSLRRPDIVVERLYAGGSSCCIIEVKRSSAKQYLLDGVYKLLGYLKDFEECFTGGRGITGMLVGWSGADSSYADVENPEIIVSSAAELKRNISRIIERL